MKMTSCNLVTVLFYKEMPFLRVPNYSQLAFKSGRTKSHVTHNSKIDHGDNFQKSFSSDHAAVKGNHVVHLSVFLYW